MDVFSLVYGVGVMQAGTAGVRMEHVGVLLCTQNVRVRVHTMHTYINNHGTRKMPHWGVVTEREGLVKKREDTKREREREAGSESYARVMKNRGR